MPAKKVIFNQGCYLTFHSHPINKDRVKSIYLDPSVISTMVVSEDSRRYLEHAFPGIRVCCIHNSINTKLFSYQAHKKPQLCFMPKKNLQDITQIINILKFRGALDGFDIISIENMHESDVARIFRESLIFLSLSYQEGFALPPAEAMACGCVVIGYHGGGGKEYFSSDFCYPVETGNVIQFCQTIEEVIKLYNKNREVLVNKGRLASVYITENYARQKQEYDVLNFWKTTIGQGDNL